VAVVAAAMARKRSSRWNRLTNPSSRAANRQMPGGDHHPAWPHHPGRLGQRRRPVGRLDQVVERAEEEDGVEGGGRVGEGDGVGPLHPDRLRPGGGRLDVDGDGVEQGDPVAEAGQPGGVAAGPAAGVEDRGRRRRQPPGQQLLGPQPLERPPGQPVGLLGAVLVVGLHGGVHGGKQPPATAAVNLTFSSRRKQTYTSIENAQGDPSTHDEPLRC
jgi:hypothetical protein